MSSSTFDYLWLSDRNSTIRLTAWTILPAPLAPRWDRGALPYRPPIFNFLWPSVRSWRLDQPPSTFSHRSAMCVKKAGGPSGAQESNKYEFRRWHHPRVIDHTGILINAYKDAYSLPTVNSTGHPFTVLPEQVTLRGLCPPLRQKSFAKTADL